MQLAFTVIFCLAAMFAVWRQTIRARALASELERMRISEERYRTLFDFTTDGVICHGSDGMVVSVNPAAEHILGLSASEILCMAPWAIWHGIADSSGKSIRLEDIPPVVAMRDATHEKDVIVGAHHGRSGERIWLQLESIPVVRPGEGAAHQVVAVFMDATHNQRTEDRFHGIVEASPNGLVMVDSRGRIAMANQSCTRLFGYRPDELLGQSAGMLFPESMRVQYERQLAHYLDAPTIIEVGGLGELQVRHKHGEWVPVDAGLRPISTLDGAFVLVTFVDASERHAAQTQMTRLAFYDDLTGLPNRRFFIDRLQHAIAIGERHRHTGALLFLDIDNFKSINDSFGHEAGDVLLKEVSERLQSVLRTSDTVARMGGDEFVILLEELGGKSPLAATLARDVADKVLEALGLPYNIAGNVLAGSVSIGVVLWGGDVGINSSELLKRSDLAMYSAKRSGKNAVCFYDPSMQLEMESRTRTERELTTAIAEGQLLAYYQRRVDADGRVVGAELLLRWQHPTRGLIPPGDFISIAEDTGLILQIGRWVLESACRQLVAWAGTAHTRELTLSINVSAMEFRQESFVEDVTRVLHASGANPRLLEIEITESMLFEHADVYIDKMKVLRDLGLQFSLDDFGTGYSSLSCLKTLPLHVLKIDKSFVRDIESDPNDAVIVQTIIRMGQTLGLAVIAEGVETEAQYAILRRNGCESFQGFYFGRPLAVAPFEAALVKP